MKLKVCGNRDNITEVLTAAPDYLGFIFWEPSARHFDQKIPEIPKGVKKVGVFVDAPLEEVIDTVSKNELDAVQLHGAESAEYCKELRECLLSFLDCARKDKKLQNDASAEPDRTKVEIIKVFSIKDHFDFGQLHPYEEVCDYYLFDTKGELPGGNGYAFDWKILEDYPSKKPFFLSGGIGLADHQKIAEFLNTEAAGYCEVIDINSRFEVAPGLKDVQQIEEFRRLISEQ